MVISCKFVNSNPVKESFLKRGRFELRVLCLGFRVKGSGFRVCGKVWRFVGQLVRFVVQGLGSWFGRASQQLEWLRV